VDPYEMLFKKPEEKRPAGRPRCKWRIMEQEVVGTTNCLLSFHYILSILYDTDCTENGGSNNSYTGMCIHCWRIHI
jgi:hypothetical protein